VKAAEGYRAPGLGAAGQLFSTLQLYVTEVHPLRRAAV